VVSSVKPPGAVDGSFISYKGIQGGFENLWNTLGRDWQRNRSFFNGMVRGLTNPREGQKILTFLFGPRVVCSSLLHLRSSWKVNCGTYFTLTEF
jgi:hypothetical protein